MNVENIYTIQTLNSKNATLLRIFTGSSNQSLEIRSTSYYLIQPANVQFLHNL